MRKSSCSFIIFLLGVATFAFNPSIVQAAVIDASVAAEVKTGEVDDDLRYVNAQGSGNGNFTSYGVLQFDTTSLAGTSSIASVALSLSQSNAFFTNDGSLNFYITNDTSTDITPGVSELRATDTSVPTGIATGDLETLTLLGTGNFVETATGDVDTYTFDVDASVESYMLSQIAAAGPLRFVMTAGDADTSATYRGVETSAETSAPQLLVIVPEPGSAAMMIIAVMGLIAYRRRNNG